MSAFDDKQAIAKLRELLAAIINRCQGGGYVDRQHQLVRDAKRLHKATHDNVTVSKNAMPGRWWEKTLGERVVTLEAENERLKRRQVLIDEQLRAEGFSLAAFSDEAIAFEFDKRELGLMAKVLRRAEESRPMSTGQEPPVHPIVFDGMCAFIHPFGTRCNRDAEEGSSRCSAHRPPPVPHRPYWEHRCDVGDRLVNLDLGVQCSDCGERDAAEVERLRNAVRDRAARGV